MRSPRVSGFAPAAAPHPAPWVQSPAWDGIWILNALWLAPLALLLADSHPDPGSGPLDALYFAVTALFWIGHRLGSAWLAYATEAYRPLLCAAPIRFFLLPFLVTAACFAILLPADTALPLTRTERFIFLAILDYAASTYHFGAQHFGVLSLYRARAGQTTDSGTRRRDRLFALGVGGALVFLADALVGAVAFQKLWLNRWMPGWIAPALEPVRTGATLLLCAATAAMLIAELRAQYRSLPRILYILGLALMVLIALQTRSLFLFVVIWTSQHWIVASGLTSRVPRLEPSPAKGCLRRALHALNSRGWALVLLVMLTSILLLPLFEVEANWPDTPLYYGDRIFGPAAAALRTSSLVPVLLALGFASGFVHYMLDRSVYRLSDPQVRLAARGLLEAPMRRPI
ncbi:MAG TPA: hypothetical protein VJM79_01520 [Rhizorhapis sp.]|nr:hypothetical protein [Rhizorhapis sp.]